MLTPQQTNALIKDCWQHLLRLHKSLAELEMINTQAHRLPLTLNPAAKSIDPESWQKRAAEARALASITADADADANRPTPTCGATINVRKQRQSG